MLAIQIHDDEGGVTSLQLPEGAITIGRGEDCDVRLVDRNVSRRHARFVREGDDAWIEDAGARFGTYVNGERLDESERVKVGPGDIVAIGYYTFDVVLSGAAAHSETDELPTATSVPESGVLELESEVRDELEGAPGPVEEPEREAADEDDDPPVPPLEPAAPTPPATAAGAPGPPDDDDEEPPPLPPPPTKPKPKPAAKPTKPKAEKPAAAAPPETERASTPAASAEPDDFLLYDDDLEGGERSSSLSSFVVLVVVLLLGAALVYAYFRFFRPEATIESTRLPGDPASPTGLYTPAPPDGEGAAPFVVRGDRRAS